MEEGEANANELIFEHVWTGQNPSQGTLLRASEFLAGQPNTTSD